MEQSELVKQLNAKYNSEGIFFTEDEWRESATINLNNERVTYKYHSIGFPFKEHERNYKEAMTVPVYDDGKIEVVERLLKENLDWIVPLVTHE